MSSRVAVLALSLLVACGDDGGGPDAAAPAPDAGPPNPLEPPHPDEGVQFALDLTAPPNTEIWKCLVGPIPGVRPGGFLDFNRVESRQSPDIHHMDLAVLTLPGNDIEPGLYDCDALYAERPQLMEEIVLYASQHAEQELTLPPGIVAEVPTGLRTMLEVHFVNATDAEQSVFTRVNGYWIDPSEVTGQIWGHAVRDLHINVPAGGSVDEWTRCEMNADADVLVISTHTHELAQRTEVFRWDGSAVGEKIYTNDDWHAPLLMDLTLAPLAVKKGEGFEFHCHYDNPNDHDVHWGFKASDEMCQLALVYTPGDRSIECVPVASSDGVLAD